MKKLTFYLVMALALMVSVGASGQGKNSHLSLLLDGVEWAAVNVDDFQTFAARPDMFTKFYQWNRSEAWPATGRISGWSDAEITDLKWTVNPCPDGWGLPTIAEWRALDRSGSTWATANTRGNRVSGRFFGPKHASCSLPSDMNGCIFLPAAGYRSMDNGALAWQTRDGVYWSSSRPDQFSYYMHFTADWVRFYDLWPTQGLTIRCVKQF